MLNKINKFLYIFLIYVLLILHSSKVFADSFQDGVSYYQSGNYVYAESCFKNALNNDLSNDVIKYYLAITLVQNKKFSDAKVLYKNIIQTSTNQNVAALSQTGLKLLGESYSSSLNSLNVSRAVINVNNLGNIIVIDNVNINDAAIVKFIFDTGASYTTISSQLASRLGIATANAEKLKIMTGSGFIYAPKVILKKIEVNGIAAYNVETIVSDLPFHSSGTAGDLAGLLGLSFMKNFKVTLDKSHNQVILEK